MPIIPTNHPDMEKLAAFGLGCLSEAASQEIELHVVDCQECRRKVAEVPDDPFVHLLQAPAADTQALLGSVADTDPATLCHKFAPHSTLPRELEGHARYRVLEPLGAGGMGTVYKAEHRLMERVVALKIINPLLVNKPGAVARFQREVRTAAQLVHPNIVTAYDAEKVGDLHLLVMECVAGRTLAQVLAVEHALPIAQACDYLRQTALGLQYALERGTVHRDIKPQNLMVSGVRDQGPGIRGQESGVRMIPDACTLTPDSCYLTPVIKILDFGLARFVSEATLGDGATEAGALMGSPDYMAPEQGRDAHAADTRADIYAMGCTLYHLLAGQVPFPETSLLAKLEAHRDRKPFPLHLVRPGVPVELAQVVAKMMAKDPAQRYQTPAEVAAALQPFTGDEGRASGREPDVNVPKVKDSRRAYASTLAKPRVLLALAAGLLFAALGYWAAQIVFRVETPQGTLIVTSDDPDAEISVKSGGKEVLLFLPKHKKEIPLKIGVYTIELVGGKEGLQLSTKKFEIKSGNDPTTVTVEFVPAIVAGKDKLKTDMGAKDTPKTDVKAGPGLKFQFTDSDGGNIIGRIEGLANKAGPQAATAIWVDSVLYRSKTNRPYPASHTLPYNFGPGGLFQVVDGRITEAHLLTTRLGNSAIVFQFDHGSLEFAKKVKRDGLPPEAPCFMMRSNNPVSMGALQGGTVMTFDSFPK